MQQMASDIFVRILRGMGACRKKPAQPASGTLSWMTPSETLLRLCLGGFGDMEWAWGGGWRLPAFLCQTTSSPGFCPISRAHFRDRKTLRKRVHHKGPPLYLRRGKPIEPVSMLGPELLFGTAGKLRRQQSFCSVYFLDQEFLCLFDEFCCLSF